MLSNVTGAVLPEVRKPGESVSRSWVRILVGVALLVGLLLRLKGLSEPPYDSHSFRQTQTLSTIEAFHADGIDLFHPRTLYMGYPGVFVLELPLFQSLSATLYNIFGPHIELVRLLNILFGAVTTWFLFRSVAHLIDRTTAIVSALIYWLAPLNILYHRSMLLDPTAVMCGVATFYFLARIVVPPAEENVDRKSAGWGTFVLFGVAAWLTAMIKALYLWPAVLLFAKACLDRRFKVDRDLVRIFAIFAAAGMSFLAWNHYATQVNNASPLTRGVKPTGLLGFSVLKSVEFYRVMLKTRPRWWLGWIGALAYPIGFVLAILQARERRKVTALLLLAIIPPTYLVLFSDINRPHDYYQLIITPFLAVPAAAGLVWLGSRWAASKPTAMVRLALIGVAAFFLSVSILTYVRWLGLPHVDAYTLRFERLIAGKVNPRSPGMVFVGNTVSSAPLGSSVPEFVYAAKLWGYGRTVKQEADARPDFEAYLPAFQRLEYVVFYGTARPDWLPKTFQLVTSDDENQLYIFRQP